jgi:hypothetical protein
MAWSPVADIVWERLFHLNYTTGLEISHQWHDHRRDSVSGVCLARTHDLEPQPIPDDLWSYFCYQPRPGDLCLDPLTQGRDLVTAWRSRDISLVRDQLIAHTREIADNLLLYWSVSEYQPNSRIRREIWRWLSAQGLVDQIDWQLPQAHCHGRALIAYARDHSQLSTVTDSSKIQQIRIDI